MRLFSCFALALLTGLAVLPVASQTVEKQTKVCAKSATQEKEVLSIDKIDPPDWWAQFPSPMLLVHGQGLQNAKFFVHGTNVTLQRSTSSANGHWAFLWLDTSRALPQTLSIEARNGSKQARAAYALARRVTRAKDHGGFENSDVLYLIMPDRFSDAAPNPPGDNRAAVRGWHGGDLAGIEAHLGDLQQLGVTTIWTNPVLDNGATPESYHGYAATDLYAIDPHFGSIAEYRRLSDGLHAREMKLVMDLVPNHVSILHPWIDDPPAPKWLHGTRANHMAVQFDLNNLIDPHAPPQAWLPVTNGWFTDAMPDLNQENPLVRQYLIQNALWWVEKADLDGLRLDTFQYVGRDFWRDFHSALHHVYPHLTTVGEILDRDAETVSYFTGGFAHSGIDTGLDTPFDYPLNFALRAVLAEDKPMTQLTDVLRRDALYPHPDRLVTFLDNHDTVRFFTAVHGSLPKYKLALGLIFTLRGTPQMYVGDEIAMTGGDDPENRHDYPGGFPGDARNAFRAEGRTASEQESFQWTQQLLALRKAHPELENGMEQNLLATKDVFAYVRSADASGCTASPARERILALVNKSEMAQTVEIAAENTTLAGCSKWEFMAPASTGTVDIRAGKWKVAIPAESLSLIRVW